MVRPGYYPVDVLEFTPGKKNRQTYSFTGAISADISTHWRIGAGIDFTSANYSKRKDLRHSNYFLDLNFSPGFVWHDGDISVGANSVVNKSLPEGNVMIAGAPAKVIKPAEPWYIRDGKSFTDKVKAIEELRTKMKL